MLHLTGTPFAIAPRDHYSEKAPDLVQMKADSAEGFSNVDLSALIALVVIRSFAVPSQVPDSNQGKLIDSDSQLLSLKCLLVTILLTIIELLPTIHRCVSIARLGSKVLLVIVRELMCSRNS